VNKNFFCWINRAAWMACERLRISELTPAAQPCRASEVFRCARQGPTGAPQLKRTGDHLPVHNRRGATPITTSNPQANPDTGVGEGAVRLIPERIARVVVCPRANPGQGMAACLWGRPVLVVKRPVFLPEGRPLSCRAGLWMGGHCWWRDLCCRSFLFLFRSLLFFFHQNGLLRTIG